MTFARRDTVPGSGVLVNQPRYLPGQGVAYTPPPPAVSVAPRFGRQSTEPSLGIPEGYIPPGRGMPINPATNAPFMSEEEFARSRLDYEAMLAQSQPQYGAPQAQAFAPQQDPRNLYNNPAVLSGNVSDQPRGTSGPSATWRAMNPPAPTQQAALTPQDFMPSRRVFDSATGQYVNQLMPMNDETYRNEWSKAMALANQRRQMDLASEAQNFNIQAGRQNLASNEKTDKFNKALTVADLKMRNNEVSANRAVSEVERQDRLQTSALNRRVVEGDLSRRSAEEQASFIPQSASTADEESVFAYKTYATEARGAAEGMKRQLNAMETALNRWESAGSDPKVASDIAKQFGVPDQATLRKNVVALQKQFTDTLTAATNYDVQSNNGLKGIEMNISTLKTQRARAKAVGDTVAEQQLTEALTQEEERYKQIRERIKVLSNTPAPTTGETVDTGTTGDMSGVSNREASDAAIAILGGKSVTPPAGFSRSSTGEGLNARGIMERINQPSGDPLDVQLMKSVAMGAIPGSSYPSALYNIYNSLR